MTRKYTLDLKLSTGFDHPEKTTRRDAGPAVASSHGIGVLVPKFHGGGKKKKITELSQHQIN